jgi:hypothetical protein
VLAVVKRPNGEWGVDLHLAGTQPQRLAVDPLQPAHPSTAAPSIGVSWQSVNAGASWMPVGPGIAYEKVTSAAVSATEGRRDSGVIYAGTEPSAIFCSENRGRSWQELDALCKVPSAAAWSFPLRPWTSHSRWITADPLTPGRPFAATEAGALLRSLDRDRSWGGRKPNGPFDTHTLIMHRLAPNRLYSAAGDGFFQSDDGGETRHQPDAGPDHPYLWSVAASPADPNALVISAAPAPQAAHTPGAAESAICRGSDGSPWRQVREGLPPACGLLASVLAANEAEADALSGKQ